MCTLICILKCLIDKKLTWYGDYSQFGNVQFSIHCLKLRLFSYILNFRLLLSVRCIHFAGVGSSSSLSAGLATVGTLGHTGNLLGTGSSLMGTNSSLMGGGGNDIGLGVGGHFGGSGIVGAGTGIGGHTSFSGSLSGTGSNSFLGSTGGGYGNSASSLMRGGSRDFDTLSAALAGGGGSFGSSLTGRDFRDGGSDQSFANGPSRGMGMSGTSGSRRSSDTIVIKNVSSKRNNVV